MVSSDQALQMVYLLGFLVLVGSALVAGRASLGSMAKMALVWLVIFVIGFVIFSYRSELTGIFSRLGAEANPAGGLISDGELRLRPRQDGHFWVRVEVNGKPVTFLVDSGASAIGLSTDAARTIGMDIDALRYDGVVQTANGAMRVAPIRLDRIEVGPIVRRDLAGFVAPGIGDTNVLGMNFLNSLSSWRVEDGWLILKP